LAEGQLVTTKYRNRESDTVVIKSVDADLAARLPELRLPRMGEQARAAFRAILAYEMPPANGSLVDFLHLAQARGYCAHPCDWIPDYDWKYAGLHPELYQPWVDWLSEQGLTKFHEGNTITPENCRRFSAGQRAGPIKDLIRKGRHNHFEGIRAIAEAQPASIRAEMAGAIYAWGSFDGCYPWQVPLLEYFLEDKSDKVRDIARTKLKKMGGFVTEEAYARKLAGEITVTSDTVRYAVPPAPYGSPFYTEFACVSFDALAAALGLSPTELARRVDLDGLGQELMLVAARTGDVEIRSILATRLLDRKTGGESLSLTLFEGVAQPLWERGLQAMLKSPYVNSVQEYLGTKTGTLDSSKMREWVAHHGMPVSVTNELQNGELPVNKAYDPLRVLGKVVNKEAAHQVIREALAHGMSPDNPRLTMLKFNLAL
jgi:hypothetical protein